MHLFPSNCCRIRHHVLHRVVSHCPCGWIHHLFPVLCFGSLFRVHLYCVSRNSSSHRNINIWSVCQCTHHAWLPSFCVPVTVSGCIGGRVLSEAGMHLWNGSGTCGSTPCAWPLQCTGTSSFTGLWLSRTVLVFCYSQTRLLRSWIIVNARLQRLSVFCCTGFERHVPRI